VGAAILIPTILPSCAKWKGANDRVHIGHIGVGDRGSGELWNYFLPLTESRSVATCDVFRDRRDGTRQLIQDYYKENGISAPDCRAYLDMDEVLAREDIDAVHITTTDHWHVLAAIKAAQAGKHIMLAKPLGLSYPNYLILKKAVAENQVHFHYGTQQRTMRHMKLGIDLIREGKIGDVHRVDVWAPGKNPVESPVCNEVLVPDGFDFDRWTGPAPLNTYCPERVTNNASWFQYDYSIGFLAGWGAHPLDILVWAIKDKVDGTYSATGTGTYWPEGGIYDNIFSWDVTYRYENGLELHFVSTDVAEGEMLDHRAVRESNGTTFYGSEGWISLSRSSAQSSVPELDQRLNDFPKNSDGWILSEENTMGQEFLDVATEKIAETCPLDEAIISDTISHMGDIAIRSQREVAWDPEKGEVVSDPEANGLYVRDMRAPYHV
jgi:predicted dehydrogenase